MSEDLMKSIVILMQNSIGDTMRLYAMLLALRKGELLSASDQQYVQDFIEKNLDNKNSESCDDELRLQ
jgi:ribosome assembly protein YihI (activator of Der GTPase)